MKETLSDLEGDICDVDEMTDLATLYVEGVMQSLLSKDRRQNLPAMTEREGQLILFSLYHLSRMTRDLRERFFRLQGVAH